MMLLIWHKCIKTMCANLDALNLPKVNIVTILSHRL